MAFSFKVEVDDVAGALEKAKRAVKEKGGTFSGDINGGEFSGQGVSSGYSVSGKVVTFDVRKKPFIASEGMVRDTVRKFLGGRLV